MSETATDNNNIFDLLDQATETKAPGSNTGPGWTFNEDEEQPAPGTAPAAEQAEATGSDPDDNFFRKDTRPAAERLSKPRVPDEVKRVSAETATAALDSLLTMACVPLIERKMRKRLTEEEIDKGPDLEDRKDEDLQDEELRIKKKWMRTMKLRKHKLDQIPLSTKEEEKMTKAFYEYFRIKDIAMPPEWLLYINLASILIDRTIEVVID